MSTPEDPMQTNPAALRRVERRPGEDVFACAAAMLHEHLSGPAPLEDVPVRPGMREAVVSHYRRLFGLGGPAPNERHLRWLYRLDPVRALPSGSTILDLGGGWGLDALWLAALGYRVVFYQRSLSEIAVLEALAASVAPLTGALPITAIRADRDGDVPIDPVDAVLLDQRARMEPGSGPAAFEPVAALSRAAAFVRPHGHVFVLAQGRPGRSWRTLRAWRAAARAQGLFDIRSRTVCTRWQEHPSLRGFAESVPGLRGLFATDLAFDFVR